MRKNKILVLFLGFLTSVCFIELGLRSIGFIDKMDNRWRKGSSTVKVSEERVMCVGDSFVFGFGAAPAESFPMQLQDILNRQGYTFDVTNNGKGGQNTWELLHWLSTQIKYIKPKVIVALTGGGNTWNYRGYGEYARANGINFVIQEFLQKLKVYKLYTLLQIRIFESRNLSESEWLKQLKPRELSTCRSGKYIPYEVKSVDDVNGDAFLEVDVKYGWIHAIRAEYDDAINCFRAGMQNDPMNSKYYYGLGQCFLWQGDYKHALWWVQRGIVRNPQDSSLYWLKGKIYLYLDDHRSALSSFQKGVWCNRCDSRNYAGIGLVALKFKNYEESKEYFEQGIKANPNDSTSYFFLGWLYARQRAFDIAADCFRKIIDLEPRSSRGYFGLGIVAQLQGKFDESLNAFFQGLKQNQYDTDLYLAIAQTFFLRKDIDRGASWVYRGLKLNKIAWYNPLDVLYLACKHTGEYPPIDAYLKKLNSRVGNDLLHVRSLGDKMRVKEQDLLRWAEHDIEQIIILCQKEGISLVLCNYPEKYTGQKKDISQVLRKLAQKYRIPFVDNYAIFEELGDKKLDYFIYDEHCNQQGYALMARNVYVVLCEQLPEIFRKGSKESLLKGVQ